MRISISKLPSPVHCGDWHDAPLKWEVVVAGQPLLRQQFRTQKNARLYAQCVRRFAHVGYREVFRAYQDAPENS